MQDEMARWNTAMAERDARPRQHPTGEMLEALVLAILDMRGRTSPTFTRARAERLTHDVLMAIGAATRE